MELDEDIKNKYHHYKITSKIWGKIDFMHLDSCTLNKKVNQTSLDFST